MKTNQNPNPHAFPGDGGWANGMTLRDYFAAAALPAIIARADMSNDNTCEQVVMSYEVIAMSAYDIADAMLAERLE